MDFKTYLASKIPNYEILNTEQISELKDIFDELQAYDIVARLTLHKQFSSEESGLASDYVNSMMLRAKAANKFAAKIAEFSSIKKEIKDENYHF